ncbi:MAG: DNA polymerase III subunit delta' [Bifidobacteriaceae bacterium]|jgi:DNA polymerase-3 subunit delta'|nr:DNA polymerase III subunit delta' [Bifidobacteriaceae bacterium]MCI1979445.1 DNA polymerase III subunit delta' [Bifidobacteriaceae bacterium]
MSVWDTIVGQEPVIATLSTVVANASEVTQSWLMAGPPGSGRSFVARAFAAALECPQHGEHDPQTCKVCSSVLAGTHPDVTVLTTDKVTIGIDEVRSLIETSEQMPATAPWRIIIIEDVDRMTERTTNVLLKEIEEPAEHTIWILCAPSAQDVLPTIRSRTRLLTLAVPTNEAVEKFLLGKYGPDTPLGAQIEPPVTPQIAAQAARIAEGHIGLAVLYVTHRKMLSERTAVIDGVLALKRTSDAVVLADRISAGAARQAEVEVDERIVREQASFRTSRGFSATDKIPPALRREYNAIGKESDRKRSITRLSRDVLDRTLTDISSIYRDVSVLQNHAEEGAGLVNLENRSAITDLSVKLTRAEAIDRVERIALARRRLNGNGAPLLVFEALLSGLIPPRRL